MTLPVFWLIKFRMSGLWNFQWASLALAPLYVPVNMIIGPLLFIARFPFFDVMPPFGQIVALWFCYILFLASSICGLCIWAGRAENQILCAELNQLRELPPELATPEKPPKRRIRLWLLLIAFAAASGLIVARARYFISAPDIKLVYIPPGEFMMGADLTDEGPAISGLGQEPQHKVGISRGFYMSATEITQAQWKAVMLMNPSKFKGDDLPVDNVSWFAAVKFCERLGGRQGRRYRLPTEAEWEYACRAGTQTQFYFGDDDSLLDEYGWWKENSEGRTHPVGQKKPNAFGLYDMHGNVDEWCSDLFDEEYYKTSPSADPENTSTGIFRVLRGGSWWGETSACRCAHRSATYPDMANEELGFRVVMETE
jgi:hypothetical protein